MRIGLIIEYDGKDFFGWQIQPEKRTVQGLLTDALSSLLKEKITLIGSGRTDSGVHARNQTAHFEYAGNFPIERLALAVNTLLPADVRVKKSFVASDDFHAQYSAKKKTYSYRYYISKISRPLYDPFAAQIPYDPEAFDLLTAQNAVRDLLGAHDFLGFSSTGREVADSRRTIYSASLTYENELLVLTLTGNGFLYNMVRIIAGTVAEIGLRRLPESAIRAVLETKNRNLAGKTYPPQGLTLEEVEYV